MDTPVHGKAAGSETEQGHGTNAGLRGAGKGWSQTRPLIYRSPSRGIVAAAASQPRATHASYLGREGTCLRLGPTDVKRHPVSRDVLLRPILWKLRAKGAAPTFTELDFCRASALALASAKQLADAMRVLPRPRSSSENRWWPLVWSEDTCFMYVPLPDPSGRQPLWVERAENPHVAPRSVAIAALLRDWDSYVHLGVVPQSPERDGCSVQGDNDDVRLLRSVLAPTPDTPPTQSCLVARACEAPRSPVDSWIFDSGSGHDLVDRRVVEHMRSEWQPLVDAQTLCTAGGPAQCTHSLPLFIPALEEEISPWMLKNTPAVLSMGRRCVVEGYEFWWPAFSQSPRLSRPNGQCMFLTVRGNIPYLEDGLLAASSACSAIPSRLTEKSEPTAFTPPPGLSLSPDAGQRPTVPGEDGTRGDADPSSPGPVPDELQAKSPSTSNPAAVIDIPTAAAASFGRWTRSPPNKGLMRTRSAAMSAWSDRVATQRSAL